MTLLTFLASIVFTASCSSDKAKNSERKIPDKIKGMSLPVWQRETYSSERYSSALDRLRTIGVNFVAIVPTLYQESLTESRIYEDRVMTPSFSSVQRAVQLAKEKGFHIMLKPHIDLKEPIYRGMIKPSDINLWKRDYIGFIKKYAELAERYDVEIFCVGTELETISSEYPEVFDEVIDVVRSVFSGKLIYAANWTEYKKVKFWNKLDFIGIDAYFHVASSKEPKEDELKVKWENILEELRSFSKEHGKEIVFTEIGYMSTDGSCSVPWNYLIEEEPDQDEQALCYKVVLEYVFPKIKGLFWWEWEFYSDPSTNGYTPAGKIAEQIIFQFWKE